MVSDLFGLTKELPIKWLIATGDRGYANIEKLDGLLKVRAVSSINRWIFMWSKEARGDNWIYYYSMCLFYFKEVSMHEK